MSIGIVIYANPDYYPPTINAIQILSQEFDVIVIARNQNEPKIVYPNNARVYRLGKLKTVQEKEAQPVWVKVWEYFSFILRAIWIVRRYKCRLIYSYDMHGFLAGFLASRAGKKIPIIYHNHDLAELEKTRGLGRWIKRFELQFARYTDKVVFPEINRAMIFKKEARLLSMPEIVMNAPLRQISLPSNRLNDILKNKGIPLDSKIILYVGSVVKAGCILEIVKSMNKCPINSYLIVFGYYSRNYREEICQVAKSNEILNRVILLPPVPYSKTFSYIIGANVGLGLAKPKNINLKYLAGASNKLFQYMACGIPFVTNDVPEFRNMFASFGAFFADPNSPESIGKAVCEALKAGNRPIEAARETHLTIYNYETQFQSVLNYIRGIICK